jgi:hypothetical protein
MSWLERVEKLIDKVVPLEPYPTESQFTDDDYLQDWATR